MTELAPSPRAVAPSTRTLSRRRILAAGAWSVPIVVAAVAAPRSAASGRVEVVPQSGEVTGSVITFAGVTPGDTVPLVFQVASDGGPLPASASALLSGAAGIAAWDEGDDGIVVTGDTAVKAIDEDGTLTFPFVVASADEFMVTLNIGGQLWTFSIVLSE